MSSHVFHEIYLHFNWHTKNDVPLLIPRIEVAVHQLLRDRCKRTRGVHLHALNGTENHVHLAMNIEPFVTISEFVKELKGSSAYDLNKQERSKRLEWQRGYGVVSFGKQQLPWVLDYIANQKEHHAKGTAKRRLELTGFDEGE